MNELMTFETFLELEEQARKDAVNPVFQAKLAWGWYEAMRQDPNPWDDEEFFNIPTYAREQAFAELFPSQEVKYQ